MNKILISFFFITLLSQAQTEWHSKKERISFPFELTNNLIIVDVKINGKDLKMMLDTGSENNILFSFPENDSITFYNPEIIRLRGLGSGESLEALVSTKNKFSINEIEHKNFKVLLVTNEDIGLLNKMGLPINGILGATFFKDYPVEINYSKQRIYVYKERTKSFKRKVKKYEKLEVNFEDTKPYVDLDIDEGSTDYTAKLLFDSGLSDGLWLFENDTIFCTRKSFVDVLGKGLSGDVRGKKSRVELLTINNYELKDALVAYPDSLSIKYIKTLNRNGSLGGEIIKRFNWFLDYKNEVFYFSKNTLFDEPFNYNMSGIEFQHDGLEWIVETTRTTERSTYNDVDASEFIFNNSDYKNIRKYNLRPVYVIQEVRENSPADRAGLQKGDKILSINNKKAYNYKIQAIIRLFQSEDNKKIKMTVERNDVELQFEFYLEKIL